MPTRRAEDTEQPATRSQVPSLAAPAAGPTLAGGPLRVPAENEAWTYCASPTMLECHDGQIVAKLAKAWHTPGLNGNGRLRGRGEGFIAALEAQGWTRIPHDIECLAWGEPSRGPDSTYLRRWSGLLGERIVSYWTDAWTRPRAIGQETRWTRDEAGWRDFLARCLAVVWPGDLDEVQVEIATAPLLRRLRAVLGRETISARQAREACLRHLPSAHVPRDLRAVYDEFHAANAAL